MKPPAQLDFDNYHAMQLTLTEQSPAEVLQLFDELDAPDPRAICPGQRRDRRRCWRSNTRSLSTSYVPGIITTRFFRNRPTSSTPTSTRYSPRSTFRGSARNSTPASVCRFRTSSITAICIEKPGKSPHAFCTDLDREGDVRVLANIVPNEYWMGTMLHELGHAVYSSVTIPESLPYLLRTDAHILATEGMAMMFERFAGSADWLRAMGIEVSDPAAYSAMSRLKRRYKLLDLFSLVPGHVSIRKADVRGPDAGPEPVVVGPGRGISSNCSGPTAETPRTMPAKCTSFRHPRTTITTCSARCSPVSSTPPSRTRYSNCGIPPQAVYHDNREVGTLLEGPRSSPKGRPCRGRN